MFMDKACKRTPAASPAWDRMARGSGTPMVNPFRNGSDP